MNKLKELRMTLIILLVGMFFLSGCFFTEKHTVTFKTNGGGEIENVSLKTGSKLENVKEPTKEGYIFGGWYLDGEEYDFDTKIDEDITLVAKWQKIEIVEDEETTTTSTTTKNTTKEKTTKKKTTTNNATTKKKTTTAKKTTTTSTITQESVNTTTISVVTTESTTVSKTVSTTTSAIVSTTSPISSDITVPTIEPTTTVTTTAVTTQVVKVNVKENEDESLTVKFNVSESESNVESNIDVEALEKLLQSDKYLWIVESNNAVIYDLGLTENMDTNTINLIGDKEVTSFSITNDGESFIFDYDSLLDKWIIKYPTVSLGLGINVKYYNNIETAIKLAKENDIITLLADQNVPNKLNIKVPLKIDGADYKIISDADYLFDISEFDYEDKDVIFENLNIDVNSILYLGEIKINSVQFLNVKGIYRENKINENNYNILFDQYSELSKLL